MRMCTVCTNTTFYTNGGCKVCVRARSKAYREAHKEELSDYHRNYRIANTDKRVVYRKAYYQANRDGILAKVRDYAATHQEQLRETGARFRAANSEKVAAYLATWCAENKEALRVFRENRRARKTASGGKLSKGLVTKLFWLQRGKCACCGQPLGDKYALDHIMPLVLGGPNVDDNIQLLRAKCNGSKGGMHPIEFMQRKRAKLL